MHTVARMAEDPPCGTVRERKEFLQLSDEPGGALVDGNRRVEFF